MLREITKTRPGDDGAKRRWFTSHYFDLFVHYDDGHSITGFELCYDKGGRERVLTYKADNSIRHHRVDDGETEPMKHKMTPLYLPDGEFDVPGVKARLLREATAIDAQVRDFILLKLAELESID